MFRCSHGGSKEVVADKVAGAVHSILSDSLFSPCQPFASKYVRMLPHPINRALTVSCNHCPCNDSLIPRRSFARTTNVRSR